MRVRGDLLTNTLLPLTILLAQHRWYHKGTYCQLQEFECDISSFFEAIDVCDHFHEWVMFS